MRLIDADALKKSIDECDICNICPERKARCSYDCDFPDFLSPKYEALIDSQPTIEPKRGKWIEHKERTIVRNNNFIDFFPTEYECSNCGLRRATYAINSSLSLTNYCPNCGADMREVRDE